MKCPFCGHENTRVIDSRPAEDNNSIRRRRVCDECGKINALCNCNSTTNPINPPGSGETIEPYSIN